MDEEYYGYPDKFKEEDYTEPDSELGHDIWQEEYDFHANGGSKQGLEIVPFYVIILFIGGLISIPVTIHM